MDEKRIQNTILKKTCTDEVNNYDNAVSKLPVGLKILIVDDDRTCLLVLEKMLLKLSYEVTKCQLARDALALLGENKNRFDIVICDLHLPDMDGFKLLEIIRLEMDLPVVMMSSDDGKGVVIKGILNGACDYLVKPVRMEAIRFIWQHVVRKRELSQSGNNVNQERLSIFARDKKCLQSLKRQKEGEEDDDDVESSDEVAASNKKPRMIWTQELHDVFVAAINQLGHDKAVPKKILERMQAMNVTGITRANIASHLQKYRMHLQKVGETSTESRDLNAFLEQSSFLLQQNLQVKVAQPAAALCNQLRLQNSVAPQQSYRFERANENYLSALTSQNHQGSHVFNSPMHNPHLIYQNDYPGDFVISNEEYFCRSVTNVTEHSNNQDDLLFHGGPFV